MKLDPDRDVHLTYCTNIHPGETWAEVQAQLAHHLPEIKRRLVPDRPFGVGLRLSAIAAEQLSDDDALAKFQDFLGDHDLYVFTINGFPYGEFHGAPVKQKVYRPDWRDEARLAYTNRLADLLVKLLPRDSAVEGSISTVPGGFRPEIRTPDDIAAMTANLVRHAAHLAELHERTGRRVCLALEPEPCCFIETIGEAVAYFRDHVFGDIATTQMADLTGLGRSEAAAALRRHVGVCVDLCHAAVEFEDVNQLFAPLQAAGIDIAKIQVSAGLRLPRVDMAAIDRLRRFDDRVYLHQVVEQSESGLRRFLDLPEAFEAAPSSGAREWRVHFHVPIFLDDLGAFSTTQHFLREALRNIASSPVTSHLEVETYTWDVLPADYRESDITSAIIRELDWARAELVA